MAELQMLSGTAPGRRISLKNSRNVLGRHPDCDVVLDSAAVSRQHAQIVESNGDFLVEDMGSRNGTYVNSKLLDGPHRLADGDHVTVCDQSFRFLLDRPEPSVDPTKLIDDSSLARAVLVDDELTPRSTITSRLDISSSNHGIQLSANPEAKLKAMVEIAQSLAGALSVDDLLHNLLDSLFKIFIQADRGFIVLRGAGAALIPKAVRYRRGDEDDVRISRTIVNHVLDTREAILSADATSDQRFDMSESIADFRIRSMMCVPIVDSDGHALGVIQVDTLDQRTRFQEDDLQVLASVASQAAIAIDNADLHEERLRQRALERDLSLARKMQQSLLPAAPPQLEGYHFFDYYQAAREVGGDYYDYVVLPDRRLAVTLADVSGKGIAAALLMARLSSEAPFCLASCEQPSAAVQLLNRQLTRDGWDDRFVTMVVTVLDSVNHQVTIVNAGHMAPLLRHGDCEVIEVGDEITGPPLGVAEEFPYEQTTIQLDPGDFLTLYSDGISEAMNRAEQTYGIERLHRVVGARVASVEELGRHILDDVRTHVGGRSQSDDMCLACFGRRRDSTV